MEIPLRRRWSSVNLLQMFRTPFPRSTSGRLVLSNGINNKTANLAFLQQQGVLHILRNLETCENPVTLNFVESMKNGVVLDLVVIKRQACKRTLDQIAQICTSGYSCYLSVCWSTFCHKINRNWNALARNTLYMEMTKRRILMNAFQKQPSAGVLQNMCS